MPRSKIIIAIILIALSIYVPSANAREMKDFPLVRLQSLDKITARTLVFQARVGETVKFGSLYIKVQSCRKAPPIEQPESAAFLQIWELQKNYANGSNKSSATTSPQSKWIFSGWMFSSSPALSSMNHPIYDVWVLDCLSETGEITDANFDLDEEQLLEGEGVITEDEAAAVQPDVDNDKSQSGGVIVPAVAKVESEELLAE